MQDGRSGDEPAAKDERLRALDARLREMRGQDPAGAKPEGGTTASGIGQAMRLSTEFIAGILVGGTLGWAVDRWFGTAPWGMIVLLMFGFGAAVTNVVRAAGLMKPRAGDKSGAP